VVQGVTNIDNTSKLLQQLNSESKEPDTNCTSSHFRPIRESVVQLERYLNRPGLGQSGNRFERKFRKHCYGVQQKVGLSLSIVK
jgi:hypothetical protein